MKRIETRFRSMKKLRRMVREEVAKAMAPQFTNITYYPSPDCGCNLYRGDGVLEHFPWCTKRNVGSGSVGTASGYASFCPHCGKVYWPLTDVHVCPKKAGENVSLSTSVSRPTAPQD